MSVLRAESPVLDFATEEVEQGSAAPAWSPARRLLFRFGFAYLVLYNFPFPLYYIPYVGMIAQPYSKLWNVLVPWVGKQVFGVDITVQPNGSGDTTYNYVQVLCFLVLAVAAAALWTLLDRRRAHYARLSAALRIYVRYVLALTMLSYGAAKVVPAQFPAPSLDRLLQPIGDSSPMGLLWTFMGFSAAYCVFTGAAEMLGGLLLTVRRTTLLGALVCIAVLANVVMLNFSYDVPVKLYSLHLLAMAVYLALPDLRRLAGFLVLNRAVAPAEIRPLFARRWLERTALVLRTALVAGFAGMMLYQAHQGRQAYGALTPRSPLHGIWEVAELEVDGRPRPPLVTDRERWRRVVFDFPGMIAIQLMDDSRQRYVLALDEKKRTLALTKRDDSAWKSSISYRRPEPGLLRLQGSFDGQRIRATLRRVEKPEHRLLTRGFHWINEYPFNR